jgi:hypothetical protein
MKSTFLVGNNHSQCLGMGADKANQFGLVMNCAASHQIRFTEPLQPKPLISAAMSTVEEQGRIISETCRTWLSLPLVPISQQQAQSSGKRASKGGAAIDQVILPAPPEDDLKDALFEVIEALKSPEHDFIPAAALTQVDTAVELIRDEASKGPRDSAILYMHGGAL